LENLFVAGEALVKSLWKNKGGLFLSSARLSAD